MAGGDAGDIEDELGDLLFTTINLARKLHIDPGRALRNSTAKFEARFRRMEEAAGGDDALEAMSADKMEALWQQIKAVDANETAKPGKLTDK
jgi:uncharacterized protein YabN with tetrapyrrole methylase and pyrophosphatase domain